MNKCNTAISCTVEDCKHHNTPSQCCELDHIKVSCCGPATSSCACTECDSYQKK